jgi:acetyl-CoA acetyltransferase
MDVIELDEAFAAQGLAVLRQLGLQDDDAAREPLMAARSLCGIPRARVARAW